MNIESCFNALAALWVVGEILIALFVRTGSKQGKVQDRGTQIILWIVIVASLSISGRMHPFFPPDMPGRFTWLRPLALAILILGLAVRATAIITLGRAFSANVATHAGQALQRTGLYSLVRHPSYLGLELIFLAYALHSRTWACFAVILVPTTLAVLYRISVEENALRLAFGTSYDDYCRTTRRLIPGIY